MSDPATYRTREEVDAEKKRDPLLRVREWLISEGTASESQLDALDHEVKEEVRAAVTFAEQSPPPPVEALWQHVLV